MYINRIKIKNFKSILDCTLEGFKPINIFIGKNNTGKSSWLQAIYNIRDPWYPNKKEVWHRFIQQDGHIIITFNEGPAFNWKMNHDGSGMLSSEPDKNNVYYIKSERGEYHRAAGLQKSKPDSVGFHGDYTFSIMAYLKMADSEKYDEIVAFMNKLDLDVRDLSNKMPATSRLSLKYLDPHTNITTDIKYGGFGQKQLVPLVVQAYDSPKGSILCYEEPEVSLHPSAQRSLLNCFYRPGN